MSYDYITENNLENIQDYMYSRFLGEVFLDDYKHSRAGFIDSSEPFSLHKDIRGSNVQLNGLINRLTEDKWVVIKAEVDVFVKRFEVRKRIYGRYMSDGRPDISSGYSDYNDYLALAYCLVKAFEFSKNCKFLSCLLKVDDTLISLSDSLDQGQRNMLTRVVSAEIRFIDELIGIHSTDIAEKRVLPQVAILASDTARTKSYLYALCKNGMMPSFAIVYSDDTAGMEASADNFGTDIDYSQKYCNLDIPVVSYLKKEHIPYVMINNKDINSEPIRYEIIRCKAKYLIYSGYGGYILRQELFQLGKEYIHIHAGLLPKYRGSTTAYYSILQEHCLGATAIFLNEKIDEGRIITSGVFPIPENDIDIDYVYEPWIRSEVLIAALRPLLIDGEETIEGVIGSIPQDLSKEPEIYYIIHPVLKHIAILGLRQEKRA